MNASVGVSVADERLWLLRAVTVLVSPREVFDGLRNDSDDAARSRSEAVLALILLSGIGSVLWTPVAGRVLNDVTLNWVDVAVWAFIGGGIYAVGVYYLGGLVLYWLTRIVGGITYRQARQALAFASAPIALSLLLVWPVRLAFYGEDLFRTGGADHGSGNSAFVWLELGFLVWALGLLALGLRTLHRS